MLGTHHHLLCGTGLAGRHDGNAVLEQWVVEIWRRDVIASVVEEYTTLVQGFLT